MPSPSRPSEDPQLFQTHGLRTAGRLMIVDDDERLASVIARLLESQGYDTTPFSSQREAIDALRAEPGRFELVLTDLTMPQMSLSSFVSELREISPGMPIIVSTGRPWDFNDAERARLGVAEVLSKPWVLTDALAALKRTLATRNTVH
jgi:DNA-binding NtrC family response regulator